MKTTKQEEQKAAPNFEGSRVFFNREHCKGMGRIFTTSSCDDAGYFLCQIMLSGYIGEPSSIPPEWTVGKVLSGVYRIRVASSKKTRIHVTLENNEVIDVYLKDRNSGSEELQEEMAKIVQFPVRQ